MSGIYAFQSNLERDVYNMLVARKLKGEIKEIQIQDHIRLSKAQIVYIADFKVTMSDGEILWVEAKGMDSQAWQIKKRLWEFYGPGRLLIYGPNGTSYRYRNTIMLREEIKPHAATID